MDFGAMENKRNKSKNILSYVIIGLILVCVVLLVTEISINTAAELKANGSKEDHSVVIEDLASGALDFSDEGSNHSTAPIESGTGN
jgi:hypothetical protein